MALVRLLSRRLCETETCLAELVYKEVPARLAGQIIRLVESEGVVTGEGYKIRTPYTHEQLADMIGTRRVPVTRSFGKLKETGTLVLRDKRICVVDLDALKGVAAERETVA